MKKQRDSEEFLHAIDAIMERLLAKRELSVAQIAKELGYQTQKLRRYMHSATGGTCSEYMAKFRMAKARTYLLDAENYPVSRVAYMCGFDEPTHFTRFFRNAQGVTPVEFRRLAKRKKRNNN